MHVHRPLVTTMTTSCIVRHAVKAFPDATAVPSHKDLHVNMTRNLLRFGIALALSVPAVVQAQNPAVTINVDANANRRAISPLIYGIAYGNPTTLAGDSRP